MTEPLANKIGVANLGPVYNQTNHITIHQGEQVALIYSDPVPDLRVFQGRQAEQVQLNTWLAERSVSLICLRGEGGIGKSTLMAKVFAESLGFAGKFWADVRSGTSFTDLAERALQELGVPPGQVQAIEEKDLMPRLLRQLQQGRYLLAIDNLESVLTATGDWHSGYETFLESFQDLGSESVLLLASREYPPKYFGWLKSRWLLVEQGLEPAEGAALLEALEVEDTAENREAVSVQVQGHPLALSLMAGWLRQAYRPGERTLERLQQQSDLWQLEGRHRGEQRISVERVLQWSMERLTPELQHLLTQVSVLRGAFNVEAAGELAPEQTVSEADLDDLERRALLQLLPERDKYGLPVFRLQPRIRDFLQRRATDLTTPHERAIAYFWSRRITEFPREGTQAAVSEYEETFYHACQLRLYLDAAATVFACDAFLRRCGYYQLLVDLYRQLHVSWQPTPEQRQDYAAVCNNLGIAYFALGQYQRAINFQQQSLEIMRAISDRKSEANSFCNLGNVYHALGQYQRAIDHYQQALEIQREIDDYQGKANSLIGLGNAYYSLGQYQRAIDHYQQALEIQREIDDCQGKANSLIGLGNVYHALGQYQRAIDFHQQALEIRCAIGNRQGEANSLGNLGNAYSALGQYQWAIDFHQQSLEIKREIGDHQGEANSLIGLGSAYFVLGQYQRAIDFYQQALEIKRKISDRQGEAASLANLGLVYDSLGQYQWAINFLQQALEIMREIGDRWGEGASLFNLGNVLRQLDRHDEALQHYQQALAIYEALDLDQMVKECREAIAGC